MATPEFGERVEGLLKARGYWKNGKAMVYEFAWDYRFNPSGVYRWIAGEIPRAPTLRRLAQALETTMDALLGYPSPPPGKPTRRPTIRGGSGVAEPLRPHAPPEGDTQSGVRADTLSGPTDASPNPFAYLIRWWRTPSWTFAWET